MTRRDRAAMVLAYECVRGSPPAGSIHDHGDRCNAAVRALLLGTTALWPIVRATDSAPSYRLLRARLALLLRASLREAPITLEVDFTCDRCGDVVRWHGRSWSFVPALMEHGTRESSGLWCGGEGWRSGHRRGAARYHALWEQSPPHREATR